MGRSLSGREMDQHAPNRSKDLPATPRPSTQSSEEQKLPGRCAGYDAGHPSTKRAPTDRGVGSKRKSRWMSRFVGWIATSEPSADALRQHRQDTYRKAGLSLTDPDADAKLHVPIGEIPKDAIRPAGRGPEPEDVALEKAKRKRQLREAHGSPFTSFTSQSLSSRSLSVSSIKDEGYGLPYSGEKLTPG